MERCGGVFLAALALQGDPSLMTLSDLASPGSSPPLRYSFPSSSFHRSFSLLVLLLLFRRDSRSLDYAVGSADYASVALKSSMSELLITHELATRLVPRSLNS